MKTEKASRKEGLYSDINWLTEQYWGFDLSVLEMGELVGYSGVTIHNWLVKHNIPRRSIGQRKGVKFEEMGHAIDCRCSFCQMSRGETKWLTDEIRINRNKSIKRSLNSPSGQRNIEIAYKRRWSKPSERQKMGAITKEGWKNPVIRKNRIDGLVKQGKDPEFKRVISESSKKRWENEEYREKTIKAVVSANGKNASKLEIYVREVLDKLYPNEWHHNNKAPIKIVGKRIPDFYHKYLPFTIETNGTYWHSEKMVGVSNVVHEEEQIAHYKKYGYECIVFWENEVRGINFEALLIERLMELYLKQETKQKTREVNTCQVG